MYDILEGIFMYDNILEGIFITIDSPKCKLHLAQTNIKEK